MTKTSLVKRTRTSVFFKKTDHLILKPNSLKNICTIYNIYKAGEANIDNPTDLIESIDCVVSMHSIYPFRHFFNVELTTRGEELGVGVLACQIGGCARLSIYPLFGGGGYPQQIVYSSIDDKRNTQLTFKFLKDTVLHMDFYLGHQE